MENDPMPIVPYAYNKNIKQFAKDIVEMLD
jgi:hypothetical protein